MSINEGKGLFLFKRDLRGDNLFSTPSRTILFLLFKRACRVLKAELNPRCEAEGRETHAAGYLFKKSHHRSCIS